MKILILLFCLIPTYSLAGNFLTFQEFKKLPIKQKVASLKAYREFVHEYYKDSQELDWDKVSYQFRLLNEAFAADNFDCFYAGWPSTKRVVKKNGVNKSYCSNPAKTNSHYSSLAQSCGASQMLCQPVLFGTNVCVDVKTQAQRNSAFSQCQQKFEKSGKTLEDLAKELSKEEMAPLADEMFALASDICSQGFQSRTGMCANLKKQVAKVKESVDGNKVVTKNDNEVVEIPVNEKKEEVVVVDQGKTVEDDELKEKLIKTVDKVNTVPEETKDIGKKTTCTQCEQLMAQEKHDDVLLNHEASEEIDQSKVTPKDYCAGGMEGAPFDKYSQSTHYDSDNELSVDITYQEKYKDKENRIPGGFEIRADRMGKGFPYIEEGVEYPEEEMAKMYPQRNYSNLYEGRGKEGSFEIIDSPVKTVYQGKSDKIKEIYHSTDIRITQYAFFPRKNVPSVKVRENQIFMKLTTGEEVVVDKKTGHILSGAAKEIAPKNQLESRVDKAGNKNTRLYPDSDFQYQGEGLFIESRVTYNTDERKPGSIVPVKALVDGNWQECKLKSEDIWAYDYGYYLPKDDPKYLSSYWSCTRFKFERDQDLYTMIKKKCPGFRIPSAGPNDQ